MQEQRYVTVKQLKENFNLNQITANSNSLTNQITSPDILKPGLELAGFFQHENNRRLIFLSNKELNFIDSLSLTRRRNILKKLIDSEKPPAIIICSQQKIAISLINICKRHNIPILQTNDILGLDITTYLAEELSDREELHGVLLNVYGRGVLITGKSGIGKSEIALELIRRNHLLVADDLVICYMGGSKLQGKAPDILAGMLEIRGVGIIDVARMFGASSVLSHTFIDLVIHLESWKQDNSYDRVGIDQKPNTKILNKEIVSLVIPVLEGRSMAIIIESAVRNFILQEMGLNSAKEFEKRVLNKIAENNQGRRE